MFWRKAPGWPRLDGSNRSELLACSAGIHLSPILPGDVVCSATTSTNSAITWTCSSSEAVSTIGVKSGLRGFNVMVVWRQESPSCVFLLS